MLVDRDTYPQPAAKAELYGRKNLIQVVESSGVELVENS